MYQAALFNPKSKHWQFQQLKLKSVKNFSLSQ